MQRVGRLLRTVAHLAPSQVWHRLRLDAQNAIWERSGRRIDVRYRARARDLPPARLDLPGLARVADLRVGRSSDAEALAVARDALEGRFTYLGRPLDLGPDVDWFRPELDAGTRLWKTLLHEFHFAIDLARAARSTGDPAFRERLAELVDGWIPVAYIGRPGFAHDVWDPRGVSTRLMNWAVAASILGLSDEDSLGRTLAEQISLHALFLREHLELDLRGNHLLRDYAALTFSNEMLGHPKDALDLLRGELVEQILPDGCHIERSPLYHAIVLQDLVECRTLLGDATPAWLDDTVVCMAGFLSHLLPPDGQFPLLGDTWHGEVDPRRVLAEAGDEARWPAPREPGRHSGLVVLAREPVRAIVLCGAHGPDYQMGHTHADGLSFELYRGPDRVVTDTGTATYDPGPARERVRSTAAHNTVQIDGEEQLEAWGSFRVGRRGRGHLVARGRDDSWDWVWAHHDGYRWLAGNPEHQRLVAVSNQAAVVLDAVTGGGRHRLRSALHLHPDTDRTAIALAALGAPVFETEAPLHERFNESRQMTEVFTECEAELPWIGGWVIAFGQTPLEVDLAPREGGAGVRCAGTAEFEIDWSFRRGSVEFSRRSATGRSAK